MAKYSTPGVYLKEYDKSDVLLEASAGGAAIALKAPSGPMWKPVTISSVRELQNIFGNPTLEDITGKPKGTIARPINGYGLYAARYYVAAGQPITIVRAAGGSLLDTDNTRLKDYAYSAAITSSHEDDGVVSWSSTSGIPEVANQNIANTSTRIKAVYEADSAYFAPEGYDTDANTPIFGVAFAGGPSGQGDSVAYSTELFSEACTWLYDYDEEEDINGLLEEIKAYKLDNTPEQRALLIAYVEEKQLVAPYLMKLKVFTKSPSRAWPLDLTTSNIGTQSEEYIVGTDPQLVDEDGRSLFIEDVINGRSPLISVVQFNTLDLNDIFKDIIDTVSFTATRIISTLDGTEYKHSTSLQPIDFAGDVTIAVDKNITYDKIPDVNVLASNTINVDGETTILETATGYAQAIYEAYLAEVEKATGALILKGTALTNAGLEVVEQPTAIQEDQDAGTLNVDGDPCSVGDLLPAPFTPTIIWDSINAKYVYSGEGDSGVATWNFFPVLDDVVNSVNPGAVAIDDAWSTRTFAPLQTDSDYISKINNLRQLVIDSRANSVQDYIAALDSARVSTPSTTQWTYDVATSRLAQLSFTNKLILAKDDNAIGQTAIEVAIANQNLTGVITVDDVYVVGNPIEALDAYIMKVKGKSITDITDISPLQGGKEAEDDSDLESTEGWSLLANKEKVIAPLLIVPTYDNDVKRYVNSMIIPSRKLDCMAVGQSGDFTDYSKYNTKHAQFVLDSEAFGYANSSYQSLICNWSLVKDSITGRDVWLPNVIFHAAAMARTDVVANVWDAPSGQNRGAIANAKAQLFELSDTEIGTLYDNNINSPKEFMNRGTCIWGQKTAQRKPSALDRIAVRRTLLFIETTVQQFLNPLVLDVNNTPEVRLRVWSQINNFLQGIKTSGGLTDYQVICDDSNNPAAVIDANTLNVDILVKPVKTIEFVSINVIVGNSDSSFEELRVR
jgi:hypothetical protein